MKTLRLLVAATSTALLAGCSSDTAYENTSPPINVVQTAVVNARATPIDVLVDGVVVRSAVAAGTVQLFDATSGDHSLVLRQTGTNTSVTTSFKAALAARKTFAALNGSNGSIAAVALDDTGSVVPVNATKVRVLHLAPNAGVIQVYRTQPDYSTPISWQFPFVYNAAPNSLNAPFYQSTVGTWEIRAWQTPADASGWANAPIKVSIPLSSGQRKTLLILDKDGGGIRAELID